MKLYSHYRHKYDKQANFLIHDWSLHFDVMPIMYLYV